ncbi:MAG: hypothetical protein RIR37_898 [Verrucomicrobiota bacterium]|jgi:glucose-6-phosphate 1-epimerase
MTLPPTVTLIDEPAGYPVLVIDHPTASGRIALNGAHVMEWVPKGQKPVLYMSPLAKLETGKAIRGGVPLCWPWFGPRATGANQPAHGFVRLLPWTLGAVTEEPAGVNLEFLLRDSEATNAIWPQRFELRLEVKMGATLSLKLTAKNTGDTEWSMIGALHTYLSVADVAEAALTGLDGNFYVEPRLSAERVQQSGPVHFDKEVDRNYESCGTVSLIDRAGGRALVVEKGGSQTTVVWNPWIEKTQRLADLPDDAYHSFVCVEALSSLPQMITLAPGEEHTLSQRIHVESL